MRILQSLSVSALFILPSWLSAATLQVGPGQAYSKPCSAIASAAAGDTILIDAAGSYGGDVCIWYKDGLTLRGINGRPKIDAMGQNAAGKGIWVIDGNNTTVENIEFTGAVVPDGNGAGIRGEAPILTVRNCYFHHNQDGILAGVDGGEILVEYSEFGYNGTGNGFTHNIYVGGAKFTLRYSYSHHAYSGQLVKSRALENHITYNRLTTEDGNTSYEIDLPGGGLSYVIGNLVQQGVNGQNGSMLEYKLETSNTQNPDSQLFVINNTFVNQRANAIFLNIEPSTNVPAIIKNNIFYGGGTVSTQANAILSNNLTVNPLFVNAASFDYRLQPGSPAINAGVAPGSGSGQSLNPDYEYIHPTCGEGRISQGTIDIGAYEYGGGGAALGCSGGSSTPVLSSLAVSPSAVVGGSSLTGTVSLNSLALSGGALVSLSSSNSSVASTPVSITVPAGASSVTFPILAGMVSSVTAVTFTATYAGVSLTANLSISPMTGSALFLKTDIATQGNWKSVYGGEGAVIVGDGATYPSYATVTPASNNAYVWAASTSDTRALLKAASSSDRVAGCWYSSAGFTIALNFTDGQTHQVGLYALDFDNAARNEKIEVLDSSGTLLDTRTLSNFTGGQYLVWTLGGRITLRVTNLSGANAVIGGIFFGSPSAGGGSGGSGGSGSAAFLKNDTNTAGNWKSVYGGEGAVIVGDSAKYPTYATVTPAANNAYVWAASTSDTRALLKAASSSDRIAGCWYSSAGFTIALNFTDGQTHQVGLYALDFDNAARSEKVEVLDSGGTVLDTRTLSNFTGGQYVVWTLGGRVTLRVTNLSGANAVIGGIFFGPGA